MADKQPRVLFRLSQAIASGITQARLEISKMLSGLYVRGSSDPEDYGEMVYTGDIKRVIPQAYKTDLDKLGYMFDVPRRVFENDEAYRQRIVFSIKATATKKGMVDVIKFIFENSSYFDKQIFDVKVLESFTHVFDGATTSVNTPLRSKASLIGGITLVITPKEMTYLITGVAITREEYVAVYGVQPEGLVFVRNIDYKEIYSGGEYSSLRSMFEILTAAGISLDRVIFEQSGSGGNKGEYYAYEI
jgi:hypothetical protein